MNGLRLPVTLPGWVRQSGRAVIALGLGIMVGLTAAVPMLLIAVAVVLVALLVTASLRRPDPLVFLAFVFIAMPKIHLPGSPLPLGESLMLLASLSAFLTLKEGLYRVPRWAAYALAGLMATFMLSSAVNGLFDFTALKRIIHLLVYVLVVVGLTRGLLSRRVALVGILAGMIFAVFSGFVFASASHYQGRLTGFFGDPNVAGLLIVVLGTLSLTGIRRTRTRALYLALMTAGLVSTFSRTAFLAAIVVALWVWLGPKLRPIPAAFAVLVAALAIGFLPTSLQSVGPFSDRTGSDQLRDRVASQEVELVKEKPILGHGAGTATVLVNFGTARFFFHNSYLAMIEESGILGLAAFVVLFLGTFLAMISLDTTDRQPLLEGALIGVAIMAINLGEVLIELSAAIAIGFALAHVVRVRWRKSNRRVSERVA